jgi:hypothetical protein
MGARVIDVNLMSVVRSLAVFLPGVSCFCPAPDFGIIDAHTAGELVADGVATGRFLILTVEDAASELRERGSDIEAYLRRVITAGG